MDDVRKRVLQSHSKVRLVEGRPGSGKTYLGCAIADYELLNRDRGLSPHQKILFLTFARNAVARIRQVYLGQITQSGVSERLEQERAFQERVRIDTFSGFFWWLVGAYGAYGTGRPWARPWLIGDERVGGEAVPQGYEGYTFDEMEALSQKLLSIPAVRQLVCDIFPLIIIDEHQDVGDLLHEIITLLGKGSRLVLLRGSGQCLYARMKCFDPERIRKATITTLTPEVKELLLLGGEQQRLQPALEALVSNYNSARPIAWRGLSTRRFLVPRSTRNGGRNSLETRAGLAVWDMYRWLKPIVQPRKP